MAAQTKKQQLKEIEYQTRMLNNLKKWIHWTSLKAGTGKRE